MVRYRTEVARQYPDHYNRPIGGWGASRAKLLLVGLAPGLHGAARTGRAFVGDASGGLLFEALFREGFADSADPSSARLIRTRITNVVKCVPPGNAPTSSERSNCAGYLAQELAEFVPDAARLPRVIVALGGVAYQQTRRTLGLPAGRFGHGVHHEVNPRTHILGSYHPSRLNVNTGRIDLQMLRGVLKQARHLLELDGTG